MMSTSPIKRPGLCLHCNSVQYGCRLSLGWRIWPCWASLPCAINVCEFGNNRRHRWSISSQHVERKCRHVAHYCCSIQCTDPWYETVGAISKQSLPGKFRMWNIRKCGFPTPSRSFKTGPHYGSGLWSERRSRLFEFALLHRYLSDAASYRLSSLATCSPLSVVLASQRLHFTNSRLYEAYVRCRSSCI